ncbi:citrate synthase [Ktedonospora formicarum]|uniref:Citrate synthase n=1 Tax=Ktedonospora formicarum TaxID=2778364 RepID=A0A8J3I240_9CHLR|nr:citrate synthase [Ktedonospora formicarum]GHO44842.1 citrate synthase 2 [Ktedonospora formicarum]
MTTAGLEDVVATTSRICDLDGELGKLTYYGVDIHDLAQHSSFEETAYLLWHGKLPTQAQLAETESALHSSRALPGRLIDLMHLLPPSMSPMNVLRTVISALVAFDSDPSDTSAPANERRAIRLTAVLPTIVMAWNRIREGLAPVEPLDNGSHAANILYQLTGKLPDEYTAHALDIALILHADHELNASTFAARVTAGTKADMYASVVSALSALSGPLHGGANEQVIRMLHKMNDISKVEPYLEDALARKERIMGFGHRVYRTEDPRATHLRAMSKELGERTGDSRWYEMSQVTEAYIKEHKHLNANVDFYSASVYYMMGIPIDLDTPIFASSRIAGWTAHILEQYANNRLIRPRAEYVGQKVTEYTPIDERG